MNHAPNPRLPPLNALERKIYEMIMSKREMGIWQGDIKIEPPCPAQAMTKAIKSLQNKNLVKLVSNVNSKIKKRLMGVDFEPAKEISGGSWYTDGKLDKEFITILRKHCLRYIETSKAATIDSIEASIQDSSVFNTAVTKQQVSEIVRAMVLDKEVEEVKSSGKVFYRAISGGGEPNVGIFSSIPCGVCPRIRECTPDGLISPQNCVYYNKWLGLDF